MNIYDINIDNNFFYQCFFRFTPNYLSFTSTGVTLYCYSGKTSSMEAEKTWTYEGSDDFLGFATVSGSDTVVYKDGDTLSLDNLTSTINLYSVTGGGWHCD